MKQVFLLVLVISTNYAIKYDDLTGNIFNNPLMEAIKNREEQRKLNLLTEFVALEWAYHGTQTSPIDTEPGNSAAVYLEEVADFVFYNYNLTLQQKVNCVKAKYILQLFELTIAHEEHVARARILDKQAVSSNRSTQVAMEEVYLHEENLVNILTMHEGQIATDLLVQSFASANLYGKKGSLSELIKDHDDIELEQMAQSIRRALGTLHLINMLLDPPHRLNISIEQVATLERRELYGQLVNNSRANFEILNLQPTEPDYMAETTMETTTTATESHYTLPTIVVVPSTVTSLQPTTEESKTAANPVSENENIGASNSDDIGKSVESTSTKLTLDAESVSTAQPELPAPAVVDFPAPYSDSVPKA